MDRTTSLIPHQPLCKHIEGEAEGKRGPEGEEGWGREMRDGQEFTRPVGESGFREDQGDDDGSLELQRVKERLK